MANLDSLAQLVEQLTFNQWVTGSSPVRVIVSRVGNSLSPASISTPAYFAEFYKNKGSFWIRQAFKAKNFTPSDDVIVKTKITANTVQNVEMAA